MSAGRRTLPTLLPIGPLAHELQVLPRLATGEEAYVVLGKSEPLLDNSWTVCACICVSGLG